ncbi:MAG: nucleotidyltransferase domain-containing protein [Acidimicrobiales bacterium]
MSTRTKSAGDPSGAVTSRLVEELEAARRDRGESKADVARGSGLGEPAVRRLLSGRHPNPTVKTLEAVAEHLGLRLTFEPDPARTAPTLADLQARADDIHRIVAAHGGSNVRVFGSVARGDARPDSDVDLLIDAAPGTGLFELGAMEDELEDALGRSVDVVTSGSGRMQHIHEEAISLR